MTENGEVRINKKPQMISREGMGMTTIPAEQLAFALALGYKIDMQTPNEATINQMQDVPRSGGTVAPAAPGQAPVDTDDIIGSMEQAVDEADKFSGEMGF